MKNGNSSNNSNHLCSSSNGSRNRLQSILIEKEGVIIMKKIVTIVLVIAVIAGVISYGVDELSSDNSYNNYYVHDTYDTHDTHDTYGSYGSYDYYESYIPQSYNCILCNNTGKVSCNYCYGMGYKMIDAPNYGGGYKPSEKVDCAYCVDGEADCTLC